MADPSVSSGSARRVDLFVCIDVDRTVLKTTTLFSDYVEPVLGSLIAETRGDDERGRQVMDTLLRDMKENTGKSFDFLAAYNERVNDDERIDAARLAEKLIESISRNGKINQDDIDRLLAPGAIDVIREIDDLTKGQWGFITSGGQQTQELKTRLLENILVQAISIKPKFQIISTEHKARDIDTLWRLDDHSFMVPRGLSEGETVVARHVVLIDDKAKNLAVENPSGITTILAEQLEMPDDGLARVKLSAVAQLIHNIDKK